MSQVPLEGGVSRLAQGAAGLALDPAVVASLRDSLPGVAGRTVAAIRAAVPGYDSLDGGMGATIETAVQTALGAFLRLAEQTRDADPSTPLTPALEGAYALGRGEARAGRTMDALLAAYRLGARVSWREMSGGAVSAGLPAETIAQFAELVFAYIDELSAASVAGHTDELATTGRVRRRYLEDLAQALLDGDAEDALQSRAARADWAPPAQLTAVLLPSALVRTALPQLAQATLVLSGDVAGLDAGTAVLLAPTEGARARATLLARLAGLPAVVGPTRPWTAVRASFERARRVALDPARLVDTEEHLAALVLGADAEALADLRTRVLRPLADLKPGVAERLAETLHAWLLLQGRREEVAAALHVHPQTVRYRMTQVRELFGDALADPQRVLELTLALTPVPGAGSVASGR